MNFVNNLKKCLCKKSCRLPSLFSIHIKYLGFTEKKKINYQKNCISDKCIHFSIYFIFISSFELCLKYRHFQNMEKENWSCILIMICEKMHFWKIPVNSLQVISCTVPLKHFDEECCIIKTFIICLIDLISVGSI